MLKSFFSKATNTLNLSPYHAFFIGRTFGRGDQISLRVIEDNYQIGQEDKKSARNLWQLIVVHMDLILLSFFGKNDFYKNECSWKFLSKILEHF